VLLGSIAPTRCASVQAFGQGRRAFGTVARRLQHHHQRQIHTPPQKTHRHGRRALAALTTTKAETRRVVFSRFNRATAWFAWIVGLVESPATWTFPGARLRCQINVNLQQQLKKRGVLQEDMGHLDRLWSWKTRDSPKRCVCSSSLRGTFPLPSRYLINSVPNAITKPDRTHEQIESRGISEQTLLSRLHGGELSNKDR